MAPLASNITGRVYFDYVTGDVSLSREHTVMWRTGIFTPTNHEPYQQLMLSFLNFLTPGRLRQNWRIIRVRASDPGTNFSYPVDIDSGLAAFVGTNTVAGWSGRNEAAELTWQGRAYQSGRRVDFSLYGCSSAVSDTFRHTATTQWVADTVGLLNSSEAPARLHALDGNVATWYPYVNYNQNSYWETDFRV